MNIKELNDITGQILRYEETVNHTKRWIERVEGLNPMHSNFSAEVELKVVGCGGFKHKGKFSLSKEEALAALKRNLAEQESIFEAYKAEFQKLR